MSDNGGNRRVLTNRQGHPVSDNQNQRTIGDRGPATLENYQFLEKISHFDRERVPERVVHARGATAFGYFEATGKIGDEPISTYTRAKLFQEAGKRTEVALRFSTVAGGRDSSEAVRDPRGFAVKFYTEDGNWDLVGNNLGVFFIRDAIKFPDFIHSQKPDPVTFERQVPNRVFDFASQTPESLHMFMLVLSPRGVPASYRTMQGFGVNTYKWVNAAGDTKLVKYHWLPKQGVKSWTEADAAIQQGRELGVHTKDLYDAIARGEYPEWELNVQLMDDHDHPELDWDPLDDTKVWPEDEFPLRPIGRMVLDRAPKNFFAESEQIAFGTGVLVDGLDFSDDKMLVGRTFSYSDTQRHRVGPNYLQLPVNQAKNADVATNQRDGAMTYHVDGTGENPTVNYEPSIIGGLREAEKPAHDEQGPVIEGRLTRKRIPRTDDYTQAGERYLLSEQWEQDELVANLIANLSQCDRPIQERMLWHLFMAEDELGQRVGEGIGISADDVRGLEPLATQTLTEAELQRAANLGNNGPRDVAGKVMTHCVPNERISLADEPEAVAG
jgi:catalase